MKATSITLMKICVSALIMHFPIKEIASRAKNICWWNDFKVNIEHVRCQSGAIKHCDAKYITDFEHKRYRKKTFACAVDSEKEEYLY